MKALVLIEVEASKNLIETMQRSGFCLCPDGSNMQIRVNNDQSVSRRKTKVAVVSNPTQAQIDSIRSVSQETLTK